jgi:hypothetical protein
MFRRRASNKNSRVAPAPPDAGHLNGSAGGDTTAVAGALVDYSLVLCLVFGGCCSYVLTFQLSEYLGLPDPKGRSQECLGVRGTAACRVQRRCVNASLITRPHS